MSNGFQQLSSDPTQSANQMAAVQDAVNTTDKLNTMSASTQALRLQADQAISQGVSQINTDLNTMYDLNTKITRNLSIGADITNLQDQRDAALTDLNKYINVKSYVNNDGALQVYTPSGASLLDNQAHLLTHAATSQSASWMSLAGGQYNGITVGNDPTDITSSFNSGTMGALIAMRDQHLVNLQSQIDTLAQQLQSSVNAVTNQGTTFPNTANSYTGSRIFANQGNVTVSSGDSSATITYNQGNGSIGSANYGSLSFSYSTTSGQPTITAANGLSLSAINLGTTFSITGSANSANNGTYTVVSNDGTNMTVARGNPVQTFSLGNNSDVTVGIFDSTGTQVSTTTLNTIMTTDYSNGSTTAPQLQAQKSYGPWSMDSYTQHMQAWIRAQGNIYQAATVNLNTQGQVSINLGSTVNQSLVFRDQVSSVDGATPKPATINFDANGDGTTAQTIQGFSNFLGLNDMLVTNQANPVLDSNVVPLNFATTATRTLTLSDTTGKIGSTVHIPPGASLTKIASLINAYTSTNESAPQINQSITISTAATLSVNNPNGVVATVNIPAGTFTLQDLAAQISQQSPGEVNATVVQSSSSPSLYSLRMTDTNGVPLQASITGGVYNNNSTLSAQLNFSPYTDIRAEVIPEGSGQRLRIMDSSGNQLYASSQPDGSGNSLLTDLGLAPAATNIASKLTVRQDIQNNPQLLSRGGVQWNDTTKQYYLAAGDNTAAQDLATAMTTNQDMPSAGSIASGTYTFSSYAASTIATVATNSSNVTSNQTYQQTLTNTLNSQFSSTSGVNLDQEVSSMIDFQQAYSASARVISVLQQMLQTLVDIIH
jgi:flagellar hook-associated protein 1 FlgK